MFDHLLLSKVN